MQPRTRQSRIDTDFLKDDGPVTVYSKLDAFTAAKTPQK